MRCKVLLGSGTTYVSGLLRSGSACFFAFIISSECMGGIILQNDFNIRPSLTNRDFGQSFLAEDSRVSIGFDIEDVNSFLGIFEITMTLYEGEGISGSIVDTKTSILPDNFGHGGILTFWDFDFTSSILTIGEQYTAEIHSTSGRGGVWYLSVSGTDAYPLGKAYSNGQTFFTADMRFQVVPTIPEPSTFLLVGIGILGLIKLSKPPALLGKLA